MFDIAHIAHIARTRGEWMFRGLARLQCRAGGAAGLLCRASGAAGKASMPDKWRDRNVNTSSTSGTCVELVPLVLNLSL